MPTKSPRRDLDVADKIGKITMLLQFLSHVTTERSNMTVTITDSHVGVRPTNRRVDDVTGLCSLRTVALPRSGRCEMKFWPATRGVT